MRKSILAALLAAALLALAGPRPGAATEAGGDGTLTIGITQFPSSWHPTIDTMMAKSYMLAMTRRPITAYNADWELVCILCTELPTLENGLAEREPLPDGGTGMAVTYELREGLTWGDGEPVTSGDVAFTVEISKHPKSGIAAGDIFQRIRSIEVHGPRRFTVHIDRVTFDYNDFALQILPEHLERPVFEKAPVEYRNRTTFDADTTNPGLYFGPYRITQVTPGAQAVFEPNPTWNGEPANFDRIVVRVIGNTTALEANLVSGSIDMIAGEVGLNLDQALALEKRHGNRFQFLYQSGLIYEHMDFNLDNPILADRRVRQAMAYAANRQVIVEQLFEGKQPVADSFMSPLDQMHAEDVPTYGYDPAKARELLDAAGWREKRKGIRHNAEGKPLRLTLMTTAGDRTRELVQQVLQSQWREVGIDIRVKNEPPRVLFGETLRKREYPGMAMYAWISAPESVPRTTLHSDQIPTEENNWAGQNMPGYANPEVDRLIDAIERELDEAARRELWAELQRIYARDLPALPLYWRARAYVLPKWLAGVAPTGHLFPTTMQVESWAREPAE